MRTSPLPRTSRRPVTTSTPRADSASGKRSCSVRCRGSSGWFGVVDRSGSSHVRASVIADGSRGGRAARSRRRSPPPPSAPRGRGRPRASGAGCAAWAGRARSAGSAPCRSRAPDWCPLIGRGRLGTLSSPVAFPACQSRRRTRLRRGRETRPSGPSSARWSTTPPSSRPGWRPCRRPWPSTWPGGRSPGPTWSARCWCPPPPLRTCSTCRAPSRWTSRWWPGPAPPSPWSRRRSAGSRGTPR